MNPYTPEPQRKSWPRRHKVLTGLGIAVALIVVFSVVGAMAGTTGKPQHVATAATQPASPVASSSPAPPPAPAPNPAGTINGSCDVSLSDSLYGQNYLTAQVNAQNTGNIGTVVRIRVSWPLQGFAPVVKTRTVRTRPGSGRQVEFNAAITENQVSNFQDVQMAASGDPCHYRATIIRTFGSARG